MIVEMKLERAATKNGGDKYAGKINGEDFSVYFPQSVSRKNGKAQDKITITIALMEV